MGKDHEVALKAEVTGRPPWTRFLASVLAFLLLFSPDFVSPRWIIVQPTGTASARISGHRLAWSHLILQALMDFVTARWRVLVGLAGLGAVLLWAYWPTLGAMGEKWSLDPQYSHGFLVPIFAIVLLWLRRARIKEAALTPAPAGLALICLGVGLHLAGGRYYYDWVDMISFLPVLAGLCLCFGGRPTLSWAWPSIAFLVFMLPLPHRIETALSQPLRRFATHASTYTLQTLGFAAVADGNTILLDDVKPLSIDEACSGLGMLVTFFAVATAVAIVVRRRMLDRIILVLSAVPIAVIANVIRIALTGILHVVIGGAAADVFFHGGAGLLMMPLAVGLLWIEMWMLSHLLVEPPMPDYKPYFDGRGGAGSGQGTMAKLA